MHRFAANRPPRPSKRELVAAAAAAESVAGSAIVRSRAIPEEAIFTGATQVVGTNNNGNFSYINVTDGLLYYYDPTLSTMYINDNGKLYSFIIGAGNDTILLRVVKYSGQYYFYYIKSNMTKTTLLRYDPASGTITDTNLSIYDKQNSGYEPQLEIVNGFLLFGTTQADNNVDGQLHCIQSDHTIRISYSDPSMNSWDKFVKHNQNLIVCNSWMGNNIVYRPISAIGLSGGWKSISLPAGSTYLWRLQLVNGEIYTIHWSGYQSTTQFIIYKLSSDYTTWTKIGQTITRADYIDVDTNYTVLKYIGGVLYLFPYGIDLFFKLVGGAWIPVVHPTDANLYLLHDYIYGFDGTFKQHNDNLYIISRVVNKITSIHQGVIVKFTSNGTLSVIPPDEPTAWTYVSEIIDGFLYTGRDMEIILNDSNGVAIKKDTTLSKSSDIFYIYYYCGQVYINYENASIWRANLVTPGIISDVFLLDTAAQSAVLKDILTNGVSGEKTLLLTGVDARGIVNAADITAGGGALSDYASVKLLALSAASAAGPSYPSFNVTSSDLDSALLYIPFNSGGVIINLGGTSHTLIFDSTASPPMLTVNGATVTLGSNFTIGGIDLKFLSRGSIVLSNATDKNSFPLRLGGGLYTCFDRTIVYTKDTIYNLRDGKTLPAAQGRYKAVAGDILRDLGETINIVTPAPVRPRVRYSPRLQYVFRLVQLVSGGAMTEGVGGSVTDDYISGFVCTWAESGRPPINL